MTYKAVCKWKKFVDFEANKELFSIFFDAVHSFKYREIETSCWFKKGYAYAHHLTEDEKKTMKFMLGKFVRFYKEA